MLQTMRGNEQKKKWTKVNNIARFTETIQLSAQEEKMYGSEDTDRFSK